MDQIIYLHSHIAGNTSVTTKSATTEHRPTASYEPLWRHLVGDHLRFTRLQREETLHQVAQRAGVSPQYLSEVERGKKEASSEMIDAMGQALGLTLLDLTIAVSERLRGNTSSAVNREQVLTFRIAA